MSTMDEDNARQSVVELLNDAAMAMEPNEKLESLTKVKELIIHKNPEHLDNFLDEVLGFQTERSADVRKWVVGFIEEACKKDPDLMPRVVANLQMMLADSSTVVRKRVIQALTYLYKCCLKWLCQARVINEQMEAVWSHMSEMKTNIIQILDGDNDGLRTLAIKFVELMVLCQTHAEEYGKSSGPNDFSLEDVPMTLKFLRRRKLEEEARAVFDELLKFHGSSYISNANLMASMSALSTVAKLRPQMFFGKTITAFEMLHANLPPTLAKSQVSSVRKHLKNQLLMLMKTTTLNSFIEKFFSNITTLLFDLGASREDVIKALPNFEEMSRRVKNKKKNDEASSSASGEPKAKRSKVDTPDADEDDEDSSEEDEDETEDNKTLQQSAVDITEKFIRERLEQKEIVTAIVLRSLPQIPPEIPANFCNSYTPIDAAGTDSQIKHVSRLLAAQMTAAGIGPGVQEAIERQSSQAATKADSDEEENNIRRSTNRDKSHMPVDDTILRGENRKRKDKLTLMPAGLVKKSSRTLSLKLTDITKPLADGEKTNHMLKASQRILNSEKAASNAGMPSLRTKIITSLNTRFPDITKSALMQYIFADLSKRLDLAFSWLYEEYCFYQGFHRNSSLLSRRNDDETYNMIYCTIIRKVIEGTEGREREKLLRRLYLESPTLTEEAFNLLTKFVSVMGSAIVVVNLMKDLVIQRPTKKLNCLNFLLEFCYHDHKDVRTTAIATVLQLHEDGEFRNIIDEYAIMYLKFLLNPVPPAMLFTQDRGRSQVISVWMEDTAKVCMNLFLTLLTKNQTLLKTLADVFVNAQTKLYDSSGKLVSVKATILRELEKPISQISMNSPGLMEFLDDPATGSELLITRIFHVLTDNVHPSPEIVEKVKKLYEEREIDDVRFLIPIINGLTKSEIIQVLPKLILMKTDVVTEVFHRILKSDQGPMNASDLFMALHNLDDDIEDPNKKKQHFRALQGAITILFSEKKTYTQEVLSIALQKLMDQQTIPFLFMWTVIKALTTYPTMRGFVINILQRLIPKQPWKIKEIWKGFIKISEKTMPQSYTVMLLLPPEQLDKFLDEAPQIREPLLVHVQNFNESQRAHVSARTMKVLYNDYIKEDPTKEENNEAGEDPMAPLS